MKNTFTELSVNRPRVSRNLTALIMRISQLYILILTSAIVSMASPGKGQAIETTTVELEVIDKPLRQVFKEIEKQTNFLFHSVPDEIKKVNKKVSMPKGKYSVKEVLDHVLHGTGLKYEQDAHRIYIFEGPANEDPLPAKPAPRKFDQSEAHSGLLVTGTVKDASTQEPLVGVNIILKGTTKGTTTDVEGRFGIEAEENDILIFTFIGFKSFETQIGGRSVIDVSMEVDMLALKEVVVNAGYYQVKNKEQTGNIVKVIAEDIQNQPILNPLQALQGRITGVYIQQNTGVPGGGFNIQIRGQNSILNGISPLYIVDGVPFTSETLSSSFTSFGIVPGASPLSGVNPADIESIEVLKDADATAIYGSRGANGVVLITTKKGKTGKTNVDINIQQGAGKVSHMLDLLNTEQYLEMRDEAFVNDQAVPGPTDYDVNGTWSRNRYTDWQDVLIGGTANTTNVNTSISGGNNNTRFLVGGGFYRETTVFPGDFSYKRGNGHLNLFHESDNKKFKGDFTVNYSEENNDLLPYDLMAYVMLPPNAPSPREENGSLNWENGTFNNNPLLYLSQKYQATSDNFIGNTILTYELIPGLNLKTSLGYSKKNRQEVNTQPVSALSPFLSLTSAQSYAYFNDSRVKTWIVEPQATWFREFGESKLDVLVGTTFQRNIAEEKVEEATGFSSDALIENIDAAAIVDVRSATQTEYKYTALFGRLNYNLKGKYIANLTARRDGSSRFGFANRFANFGAIGIAWIFSNERFLANNLSFLTFGKLRASYGRTGNDQIGDYRYIELWQSGDTYQGNSTLVPVRIANPDFAWEINKKIECAIEFGFIEDRIFISGSYYRNRSSNQLVNYSLPPSTGFTSIQDNLSATLQNSGLEFQLNARILNSNNFTWLSSANITIPRNKLISFPDLKKSIYANVYEIGKPITLKKNFHYLGVDPQTGSYTFEDLDSDGNGLTDYPDDLQALVSIGQKYFGGIQNTFSYKGFQLDFLFQIVKQNGYNYLQNTGVAPGGMSNQPTVVLGRWRQEGDDATIQKYTRSFSLPYLIGRGFSDLPITDASFIRLKNVSISYEMPFDWVSQARMKKARVFVQGQNVLTFSDYLGSDPETQKLLSLPPLRVISIGAQMTF